MDNTSHVNTVAVAQRSLFDISWRDLFKRTTYYDTVQYIHNGLSMDLGTVLSITNGQQENTISQACYALKIRKFDCPQQL